MRKGILFLILVALVTTTLTPVAMASAIGVTVNTVPIEFVDQAPISVDGRVLVPLRAVFEHEQIGAEVNYDTETRTATVIKDNVVVSLQVGNDQMTVKNFATGEESIVRLDVPPTMYNQRVLLPIRAVLEAFGYSLIWDSESQTVVIDAAAQSPTEGRAYYDDGSWAEFELDANGNIIKWIIYNADGSITSWEENEYDANGNHVKHTYYNADGSIIWRYQNEYDANGYFVKTTYYNADGLIYRWDDFEYDANGHFIKWTHYNADGSIGGWQENENDANGNQIKMIYYNADGSIYSWDEYEYDAKGNRIKSTSYNADGSIEWQWPE